MHREYDPAQMAIGHHHEHDHDQDAERRTLPATTAVVGLLLGIDLIPAAWGAVFRLPFGDGNGVAARSGFTGVCGAELCGPTTPKLRRVGGSKQ